MWVVLKEDEPGMISLYSDGTEIEAIIEIVGAYVKGRLLGLQR